MPKLHTKAQDLIFVRQLIATRVVRMEVEVFPLLCQSGLGLLAFSPLDPGLLDTRAVAYLSLGRPDAVLLAVQDLNLALQDQEAAATYFHLAQAYRQAQLRKDAAQAWLKAKKLGLTAEKLHALERPAYAQLEQELK